MYILRRPILHPAQMTLYTDVFIIPSYFAPVQSGLFPPQTHVGKLGNELALPGWVGAKRRCFANIP